MGDRGPGGAAAARCARLPAGRPSACRRARFPGAGELAPPRENGRRPPRAPIPRKNPLTQKITGQGAFCWESQLWLYRFQIGVGVDEQPLRG